ncbi:MAG: beta-lactamase family protein [Deltaproteobacteria bacterium]|nr:beta-lactamase family protein [Deltaproteobacteria bacterium]
MTQQLETATTDADFVMYLEDWAGETFIYSRGTATMETLYESASTSKWVSAAVILTLVDKGMLSLEDTPQKYLTATEWPVDATSPLYSITLAQLLSFQSGLNDDAPCNNLPNRDFFECVASIAENNLTAGTAPGESFHYASNHLQVAGAMAVRAGGYADWTSLFTAFQQQTGLFVHSAYNLPSITNPRLAGGMTWTAMDYIDFIRAFKTSAFYSSGDIVSMASSDQVGATPISYSPAYEGVQEDWHYGFGMWIECHSPVWNCQEATLVSSPGAYGAYPFWNKKNDYIGIVARQGTLGTFRNGYALFDGVRSTVDSWAVCPKP